MKIDAEAEYNSIKHVSTRFALMCVVNIIVVSQLPAMLELHFYLTSALLLVIDYAAICVYNALVSYYKNKQND